MQGWIERAFFDAQYIFRELLDALGDRVAMQPLSR